MLLLMLLLFLLIPTRGERVHGSFDVLMENIWKALCAIIAY